MHDRIERQAVSVNRIPLKDAPVKVKGVAETIVGFVNRGVPAVGRSFVPDRSSAWQVLGAMGVENGPALLGPGGHREKAMGGHRLRHTKTGDALRGCQAVDRA